MEQIPAIFLLPSLFFLRILSVLNMALNSSSHIGTLGEVKYQKPKSLHPSIIQLKLCISFLHRLCWNKLTPLHFTYGKKKQKYFHDSSLPRAFTKGVWHPYSRSNWIKGHLSQGSLQNPHGHGTEILTNQVGSVGWAMASLAACPESQLSSLLHRKTNPAPPPPKQNKIKVLFHNTESPKQSLSVAHGHERAPPRALLTPSSLRASPQGRGPGHRCCMAQRPPAAGTQMAGDSRRRGQQESSGAARHRLGRQRATGTDKAAEPRGAADLRAPPPGAPGCRPAPCPYPEEGLDPCMRPLCPSTHWTLSCFS